MRGDPVDGAKNAVKHLWSTYGDEQIFAASLLDWSRNRRADNGQPIYEESEGALPIIRKSLGYVFSEAFAPRTPSKIIRAAQSIMGDQALDPTQEPAYLLLTEIMPVKPYEHDMPTIFRRLVEKGRDERNRASAQLNRVKTRSALTQRQLRKYTRNMVETRKRVDERIYRAFLGLSAVSGWASPREHLDYDAAYKVLSIPSLGMGKRRRDNILVGRMDRPMLTPPFIESVTNLTPDGRVGGQRIRIIDDELNKYPSVMYLSPTD
jgi:hypothetical protein